MLLVVVDRVVPFFLFFFFLVPTGILEYGWMDASKLSLVGFCESQIHRQAP